MSFLPEQKRASGLSGFIQSAVGGHPLVAAALKYVILAAIGLGGYQAWKHGIRKDIKQDIKVEQQEDALDQQSAATELGQADRGHVDKGNARSRQAEDSGLQKANQNLANLLAEERALNAKLKKETALRPCLREPWSDDGLRVIGGRPIGYNRDDRNPDTGPTQPGRDDAAHLRGANRE